MVKKNDISSFEETPGKNPREKKYVRIFENAENQRKTMEVEKRGTWI